jgi:hypothetical protein
MKTNIFYTCSVVAIIIACVIITGCTSSKDQNNPPELTRAADLDEALSSFDGYLESSAADWYVNSSHCDLNACRQQLIAENGDQVVVTITGYNSGAGAADAYAAVKKGLAEYSITDVQIADAGYAWHRGALSESGFVSGPVIGVVDYQIAKGNATDQESTSLAIILADMLIK